MSAAIMLLICAPEAGATYKAGYYNALDGKKKETLKAAAKSCVQKHQTLNYSDLPNYWRYSDVYPERYNGQIRWWDMYSNEIYLIRDGQSGKSSFSANKMQREHSVPKSWWKKDGDVEYTPAYSDMWNLFPSDGPANQAKLNYPLGIVSTSATASQVYDNGSCKVGPARTGFGGGSGKVFEPADEYKGDFARSFFYMATVYDDLPWVITYMFQQSSYPTLKPWAMDMLLQWARQDPVSQKEILRNDAVEQSQGNRNPFVDFPELAEYIWGTRTGETFILSEQGGNVTPPITGDPEIISPVNGEALDFGQAALTTSVTSYLRIAGKNLTSPLSVRVVGGSKSMFVPSLSQIQPSQINGQDAYMLPIVYTPSSIGRHQASILLYDGGLPDGAAISVDLRGEGMEIPELTRLTATAATNIEGNTYTANWNSAPEVVDYYVVTRVRYESDGTQSEDVESDTNSYTFTDRDPMVMESYSVRSSRLGYLSQESNSITVLSGAGVGVSVFGDGAPVGIGIVNGGFMLTGVVDAVRRIDIFKADGTVVMSREVSVGEEIMLPSGIYIVAIDGQRPEKLYVE